MLLRYTQDNGFPNPQFYVDDGVSGTTFDRDGFKAMMSDIEAGKVGIVITKDLSRLGRDYLKTGEYIEIIINLPYGNTQSSHNLIKRTGLHHN